MPDRVDDRRESTMQAEYRSVRVWDAPVRLFHWGIVLLLATSWITQHYDWLTLHFIAGYCMCAALLFRLAWGIIGSDTARFSRFLRSPLQALHHLVELRRRPPDSEIGHNAAGGWMVLVLLLLLAVQVGTGLCSNDQVMNQGPLADAVGQDWSDWLSHIHAVNFKLIEAAVVLHLLAIIAYRLLGYSLVWPMITGRKRLPATLPPPRIVHPLLALLVLAIAAGMVAACVRYYGG
jgi:cytochrome b